MKKLDQLDPERQGFGKEKLREAVGFSRRQFDGSVSRLLAAEIVGPKDAMSTTGHGAARTVHGLVRINDREEF